MSERGLNLALDSIVKVDDDDPGRKDFVLWYLRQFGVKRLRRDKFDRITLICAACTDHMNTDFLYWS